MTKSITTLFTVLAGMLAIASAFTSTAVKETLLQTTRIAYGGNWVSGPQTACDAILGTEIQDFGYTAPTSNELDELSVTYCQEDAVICFVVVKLEDGHCVSIDAVRDGEFVE